MVRESKDGICQVSTKSPRETKRKRYLRGGNLSAGKERKSRDKGRDDREEHFA
jgi:hypothetical protein